MESFFAIESFYPALCFPDDTDFLESSQANYTELPGLYGIYRDVAGSVIGH